MNENLPPDLSATSAVSVPATTAPALWNPNAAACWCLLFSPAFGAYLQGQNAKALGQMDEAKSHEKWFYGTLIFLVLAVIIPFVPGLSKIPLNPVGLAILLGWYFTLGNKQVRYVKETYGTAYPRKAWGMPLLVAVACLVGFLIVAFVVGFVTALLVGVPHP